MQTSLDTIIILKQGKKSHGLEDEGTKCFLLGFFPLFVLLCSLTTAHAKHL